jgi:hypothetical protein
MSKSKHRYPERPAYPQPKKPRKGQGRPSSEHIHGRRKTWLSARNKVDNRGNDVDPQKGNTWYRSPLMKEERARAAELRK